MHKIDSFDKQRRTLRNRPRRIIFNNDGCDVFTVPANQEPSAENFLSQRTHALVGSQVDTICYTSISSGFSLFTHNTQVGEILARNHPVLKNNIALKLIEQGRDCLRIMVEFGHEHGMEVFWSMRMNDTHDGAHRADNPYFLFPKLKQQHPEYLLGTPDSKPLHGSWSAVDYANPRIRELAYRFVEEVCQNYRVDGVELDFFRHPVYFGSVASGQSASREECELMTELIHKIAALCRTEGLKRGRPILLAVRTPDSVDYCRAIGLDLEKWLSEGLIDIYVPSGYFQLNSWSYSAELAHANGAAVWAGLSESRVGGGHHRHAGRASDACYRARALNAWEAEVDGVYLFNLFDPHRGVWRELGDPDGLRSLERSYFASYRGRKNAAGGNLPYGPFSRIPGLNPDNPVRIPAGESYSTTIALSGLQAPARTSPEPEIRLELVTESPGPDPSLLSVSLNSQPLPPGETFPDGLRWPLVGRRLKNGPNPLDIRWLAASGDLTLRDVRVDVGRRRHITKTRKHS